jgi:Fe-S-cluster containining protein
MAGSSLTPDELAARCQRECQARCCRYITVQIDAPKNGRDLDEISWWLAHREVSVYVESRRWHLEVRTPCRNLSDENLCVIYADRPDVCRSYKTEACEYPARPHHTLQFDGRDDFEYWREGQRKRRNAKRRARTRPQQPSP